MESLSDSLDARRSLLGNFSSAENRPANSSFAVLNKAGVANCPGIAIMYRAAGAKFRGITREGPSYIREGNH